MLNEGEREESIQPTSSVQNTKNIPNSASIPLLPLPAPTMPPSSMPIPTISMLLSPSQFTTALNTSQLPDFLGGLLHRKGLDPANICEGKHAQKSSQKAQEMAKSSQLSQELFAALPKAGYVKIPAEQPEMAMAAATAESEGIEPIFEEAKQCADWPGRKQLKKKLKHLPKQAHGNLYRV